MSSQPTEKEIKVEKEVQTPLDRPVPEKKERKKREKKVVDPNAPPKEKKEKKEKKVADPNVPPKVKKPSPWNTFYSTTSKSEAYKSMPFNERSKQISGLWKEHKLKLASEKK